MARLLVVLLFFLSAGCATPCYTNNVTGGWIYYSISFKNIGSIPIRLAEEISLSVKGRTLATKAWEGVCKCVPKGHYSKDYAVGFKSGFADYIESGGDIRPSVSPHMLHHTLGRISSQSSSNIDDWQSGFLHGVQVAKSTGLREKLLIPVYDIPSNGKPKAPEFAGPIYNNQEIKAFD